MGAPMVCVQGGEPPLCVCVCKGEAEPRAVQGVCARVCECNGGHIPRAPRLCVCKAPSTSCVGQT